MGQVTVSQSVTYEGYNPQYAYATISWDEYPEVTVEITSSNISTWRVRGQNPDTTEYCVGLNGATYKTFNAPQRRKTYAFQILNPNNNKYSDGDFFTVDFDEDSGDDGGDSGGGSSSTTYQLRLYQGVGTKLTVKKTWDEAAKKDYDDNTAPIMYDGSAIVKKDCFTIQAEAEDGYDIKEYTHLMYGQTYTLPYDLGNIWYPNGDATSKTMWVVNDGSAYIQTSATLKEYILSARTGRGSYIIVNRISSRKEGASLGVLSNGEKIYHFDKLEFIVGAEDGYDIVDTIITGCTENSDGTFTVVDDVGVVVTTELLGLVRIDNGTSFLPCLIYIDNGSGWDMYIPYIDNGSSWVVCC